MLGVHRAGVFRGLGKGLRQLLLGAQLGPGLAEIGDGFEFGGRCRAAFRLAQPPCPGRSG
jgi:hypothetical protein